MSSGKPFSFLSKNGYNDTSLKLLSQSTEVIHVKLYSDVKNASYCDLILKAETFRPKIKVQ